MNPRGVELLTFSSHFHWLGICTSMHLFHKCSVGLGVQRHCCKNISFNINVYSTFNITFVTKGLTVTISYRIWYTVLGKGLVPPFILSRNVGNCVFLSRYCMVVQNRTILLSSFHQCWYDSKHHCLKRSGNHDSYQQNFQIWFHHSLYPFASSQSPTETVSDEASDSQVLTRCFPVS